MELLEFFITGVLFILTIFVFGLLYDKRREFKKRAYYKEIIAHSEELLKGNVKFAESVGSGKFNDKYTPGDEDVLGNALLLMRDNLREASIEDDKRNWIAEGIAKFANILRSESDVYQLTDQICSELVSYMNANQCQIYFVNSENKDDIYLELKASYAWGRNKYKNARIEINEGLPGRCFLEQKKIILKGIPNEFITVTSGLGKANPSNILIIPIKIEEATYGILEIASFNPFQEFEVEFVEKLSESIASIISDIKNNEKTKELLIEMEAAKNESILYQEEMDAQLGVMNNVISISKMDLKGEIIYVNEKLLEVTRYKEEELIGQDYKILKSDKEKAFVYQEIREKIEEGTVWKGRLIDKTKSGQDRYSDAIIAPLKNSEDQIIQYITIRLSVDDKVAKDKKMEMFFEHLKEEKKRTDAILEGVIDSIVLVDSKGVIEYVNASCLELLHEEKQHLIGKRIFDFLPIYLGENNDGLHTKKNNQKIAIRTELEFTNAIGQEKDVLITESSFEFSGQMRYALFIQNITVDLF